MTIYSNKPLHFAHDGDGASDLQASRDTIVPAWGRVLVPTGLMIALEENTVGLVCSRSGLAIREGIIVANAPGIIDSGYRGEVGVILANLTDKDYTVHAGDRIGQLMIIKNNTPGVEVVNDEEIMGIKGDNRGIGGFGSSGV